MKINAKVPFGTNEKTGLSQELRFKSLVIQETGYINLLMAVDVLDSDGNIFVANHKEIKAEVHQQAQYAGIASVAQGEVSPRMETFLTGLNSLVEDYLEGEVDNV